MVQRLQLVYDYQIVLISCGAFYIAIGTDAVVLNSLLGLNTTCVKHEICKVGVPKNSIKKYIEKLDETSYGYIVLDYNKDKKEIVKLYEKQGNHSKINDFNKGCSICENYGKYKITEYEESLQNFLKKRTRLRNSETTHPRCFGNIYLHEVDSFIKHKLHIKYYARYLDDSVLIVQSKKGSKKSIKANNKIFR